ncbi:flagellar hook-length control protein FliK [uncultured Abyssibacter sp.]|uniref:flagellar hook-length control protein FliK n=1 Tax=uncultured Abyssibacter sp. TaxID=2320202 RepID=UPI0032B14F5B
MDSGRGMMGLAPASAVETRPVDAVRAAGRDAPSDGEFSRMLSEGAGNAGSREPERLDQASDGLQSQHAVAAPVSPPQESPPSGGAEPAARGTKPVDSATQTRPEAASSEPVDVAVDDVTLARQTSAKPAAEPPPVRPGQSGPVAAKAEGVGDRPAQPGADSAKALVVDQSYRSAITASTQIQGAAQQAVARAGRVGPVIPTVADAGAAGITAPLSISMAAPLGGDTSAVAAMTQAMSAAPVANPEQLAAQLQLQLRDGVNKATVRLHPESLGELQVAIETVEQQVRVVLAARQPESLDWLQHSLPRLQTALDNAGFSKVDVEVQQHFQDADGNSSSGREQGGDSASDRAFRAAVGDAIPVDTRRSIPLGTLGGLDTWA